jgi:hypothetical protein
MYTIKLNKGHCKIQYGFISNIAVERQTRRYESITEALIEHIQGYDFRTRRYRAKPRRVTMATA